MNRREFIGVIGSGSGAALLGLHAPGWAQSVPQRARSASDRVLILVELKGGNDGFNTIVPYTEAAYFQLRKSLAVKAEDVLRINPRVGLHPALQGLLPLWENRELAIVQGVGYPQPNLSHFRSIEIWATSSSASDYIDEGWAARAIRMGGTRSATEGVVVGGNELGPLAGARAAALTNIEAFASHAAFPMPRQAAGNPALQHLLEIENDVANAAALLRGQKHNFSTVFPQTRFGNAVRTAAQVVAVQRGKEPVPVITLTLGTFDTHQNQSALHAGLLRQLGDGIYALRSALTELGMWDRTLIMTFSEFGRRAHLNASGGTDHGTAAPHFVTGGAVRGGLYGQAPDLTRLDGTQNVLHTVDFRQLYTTIAQQWWGIDAEKVVRGRFEPVRFLKT